MAYTDYPISGTPEAVTTYIEGFAEAGTILGPRTLDGISHALVRAPAAFTAPALPEGASAMPETVLAVVGGFAPEPMPVPEQFMFMEQEEAVTETAKE